MRLAMASQTGGMLLCGLGATETGRVAATRSHDVEVGHTMGPPSERSHAASRNAITPRRSGLTTGNRLRYPSSAEATPELFHGTRDTTRDRRAALEFLTRATKRYGRPASIVTDRLPSYRAAMKVIGNEGCQETGRWLNNRAENSHQPFRRREGAMARFRDIKTLQKFTSVHASIHNHFNHQRHLNRRDIFKQGRAAALAEWRQLAV